MDSFYKEVYKSRDLVVIQRFATGEFEIWLQIGYKKYAYRATCATLEEAKKYIKDSEEALDSMISI